MEASRRMFLSQANTPGENLSALCREYGISRTTAYKWLSRDKAGEPLTDQSKRPFHSPNLTPASVEEAIVELRVKHPAWGPHKLKHVLEREGRKMPAKSTIATILRRNGCISKEASAAHRPYQRFERALPNSLWQTDFKGDFLLENEQRCFPLTVLDDCSRYSLCVDAKRNQQSAGVKESFTRVFKEYGLPDELLCDNGLPWGNNQLTGFTRFEVWLMKLSIRPIHGRAHHPQTQGKEERFHRTLKDELLKRTLLADFPFAQQAFDTFREEYNTVRPHQALDMDVPASRYRPSPRRFPSTMFGPEYPCHAQVRKVGNHGSILYKGKYYFLSEAFIGESVALMESDLPNSVDVMFYDFRVARIDLADRHITSLRPLRRQVVPL